MLLVLREQLVPLVLEVLLAQLDRAVCRARWEVLALLALLVLRAQEEALALLVQLDRAARLAQRVRREVLALRELLALRVQEEVLALLVQLDRVAQLAQREVLALLARLDRAADQQGPLGQQAQRELLRQRALTDKFNTTMAAPQWAALRDFTTTTPQIKLA